MFIVLYCIIKKNLYVSESVKFKPMLFKGLLYFSTLGFFFLMAGFSLSKFSFCSCTVFWIFFYLFVFSCNSLDFLKRITLNSFLLDLHFFKITYWNFTSFLWWYIYLIFHDPWFFMLVFEHWSNWAPLSLHRFSLIETIYYSAQFGFLGLSTGNIHR